MKNNIVYGSIFCLLTVIGITFFYFFYQTNYVNFSKEKIEITVDQEYWTNQNVTISVKYNDKMKIKEYSFDGGKTWQKENSYVAKKNEKLEIVLKGTLGKTSSKVEYRVSNIDKEIPTIDIADTIYVAVGKEFNISDYYAISDTLSGIKTISTSDTDLIDMQTIGEYDVNIQTTDIAGNMNTKDVKIMVVDKKDPNLPENQKVSVPVTGITVDKNKISLVKGSQIKIVPTIKPLNASNKKVVWESVNTGVAKVDSKGVVTAVGSGSTTITVTTLDNSKKSEISVVVTDQVIDVESIILDRKTDTLTSDTGSIVLTATIKPENATNPNIVWSSSNLSVASVKDGVVTIHDEGDATISASTSNGKIATYHLIVRDNYIFQEREIIKRGSVTGYHLVIYKNGVDITKDVSLISDPFSVTKNRKKQFEITFTQHDNLKDDITIIYKSNKHDVKRG